MADQTRIVEKGWRFALFALFAAFLAAPAPVEAQEATMKNTVKWKELQRRYQDRVVLYSSPTLVLDGNQFQCGVRNQGDTCSDVFNSPTGGGGFWPTGSPNQYMFNSGLQVAGVIPEDAGFAWAGDTVGSYFMDARGTQQHGTPLTEIYNSLDRDDLANWPTQGTFPDFPDATAVVNDPELFNDVLLDRSSASQQDSWVMYWDGDPAKLANRSHTMGIRVEQRTLAWNFPEGNEAIIYFIYKFKNVTDNPLYQRLNEAQHFGGANELPDGGWTFDSIYVSYDADPDVTTDFDKNFSTAILPFNMGVAYEGTFVAPEFTYFPALFHPPFFESAPGMVGVKFLKSPLDPETGEEVGLTMFSVHENPSSPGAQFQDPLGVRQLWRYLSGNINPGQGDPPCTFENPKDRRLCFLAQEQKDTRFFQASGPFSLGPGESATVVSAMFAAATVNTDEITPGTPNPPGVPSRHPGCGGDDVRPIERGAGWVSQDCPANPDEPLDQFSVEFVPNSLLGRGIVAQTIFDNKFLLGFAPESPPFFLVQGDEQVTVLWQESATEENGDPFFSAAGDPDNALFNPNYREFDVEGYRIYRGTDPSSLRLIAQFDYRDTRFTDEICETDPTFVVGDDCETTFERDIVSPFIQFPSGGIVELAGGDPLVQEADTAMAAAIRAGNAQEMDNSGVPFAFVDTDVKNGFQYFYKVTAFDINSLRSGPSSLESAGGTKSVFPRQPTTNQELASFESFMAGTEGEPLEPASPVPSVDPEDGTFSGPMPPTDAFETGFAPLIRRLLPAFTLSATIDSVVLKASGADFGAQENPNATCPDVGNGLGGSPFGACWDMYITAETESGAEQVVVNGYNPWWSAFGEPAEVDLEVLRKSVPLDAGSLEQFDIPPEFSSNAAIDAATQEGINNSVAAGPQARRFGYFNNGSRWFDGESSTVADPTHFIRVGHLEAVDTVWKPKSHTPLGPGQDPVPNSVAFEKQCFNRALAFLGRSADIRFTWQGGTFGEVRDVTHGVPVQFSSGAGPTWGFLTTDANGNGVLDWQDFNYIDRALQVVRQVDGGDCDLDDGAGTGFNVGGDPQPVQLTQTPQLVATSTDGLDKEGVQNLEQTGQGFGLFINGERFIFETSSMPTDGTEWTLRQFYGSTPVDDETADDPSGYTFIENASGAGSGLRPILIPGLSFNFSSESATQVVGDPDLEEIHTVPDPYYAVSQFDLGPSEKRIRFVNLPPRATIRIYSLSGVLVDAINHDDPTGGGMATWDVRNINGQFVASGVYFFHVTTPDGKERVGKFTVVNFSR